IITIDSDTSSSFGSSSSDEYDSSFSYDISSLDVYKIVSSKGPNKILLKWYEDISDDDITEFKFLKPILKSKASSSTAPYDDTSDQDFPNDDDSNDEDFIELKVKKAKTCKGKPKNVKSLFLDSSDEDIPNSSKSNGKTLKSLFLNSSDEDIPKSSKSQAKPPKDLIQKKQFGVRKPAPVTVADGKKRKRKVRSDSSFGV
nr:hypothetical protein [Tanacetum cinerariifolium]